MSPFVDKKKRFRSQRDHKIKVRAQIKKEGEAINRLNQRGMDQFVEDKSRDSLKESKDQNDNR